MYPEQIDISPDDEARLANWMDLELTNHLAERSEWIETLKRHNEDYYCHPSTTPATYPFVGASQIKIPLTAIAVEAVHSRTWQQLDALDHLVVANILDDTYSELKDPLATYMDQVLKYDIKFLPKLESAILEIEKLGNGVAEAFYCKKTRTGIRNGEEFTYTYHDGPDVESVPLANFLMPFESSDPQTSRWCGKFFELTPNQIEAYERDGRFRPNTYERLEGYYKNTGNGAFGDYGRQSEELRDQETIWPTKVELFEIYTAFDFRREVTDFEGSTYLEHYNREIVFTFHKDSRSVISITHNPYYDLRRPYRIGKYFPLENTWTGIGIAKQNEMFQEEVTAQHRMRLDNANIANLRMFKVNRNSDIKEDEPIFPGKLWFLDDLNDLQPIEMGDVKASAYNNENQVQLYSQQRTGVNELTLGMPQVGTPGTASDSMARVQESARKFDYTFNNIKDFCNELISDTVCNISQWGLSKRRVETIAKGSELEAFLFSNGDQAIYDLFRHNIIAKVELVGQNQNKLLDRQNATQLTGMVQQYITGLLDLANAMQDPELAKQIAKHGMNAANDVMKHIFQTFDFPEPDKLIFTPRESISVAPQQPTGPQSIAGPAPSPGSEIATRLDAGNAANQLAGADVLSLLGQG